MVVESLILTWGEEGFLWCQHTHILYIYSERELSQRGYLDTHDTLREYMYRYKSLTRTDPVHVTIRNNQFYAPAESHYALYFSTYMCSYFLLLDLYICYLLLLFLNLYLYFVFCPLHGFWTQKIYCRQTIYKMLLKNTTFSLRNECNAKTRRLKNVCSVKTLIWNICKTSIRLHNILNDCKTQFHTVYVFSRTPSSTFFSK